ncbi:MAG: hypothetical protein ACI4V5_06920 [Prevotella sp.]
MKKSYLYLVIAALIALTTFTSCDNTVLTSSLAEDAVEKDVFWDDPQETRVLYVGYFEIDKEDLVPYQQMKAAGLVTFTIEKIVEKKVRYNYSYWYGRTSYTTDEDHYFINVKLTEEGKKYVINDEEGKIRKGRKDFIKDMRLEDKELNADEELPGYMTNYEAVKIGNEEIAAASVQAPKKDVEKNSADSAVVDSIAAEEMQPDETQQKGSAYDVALAKVKKEEVKIILGEWDLVKCKSVYCPEEWAKIGKGSCEIIIEFKKKTPFGFIYGAPKNKSRKAVNINLIRYEDLGWVVNENE